MIEFPCPHCGKPLAIPERYAGQTGTCHFCNTPITVPVEPQVAGSQPPFQPTPVQKGTNRLAVASLVLGIVSFLCLGPLGSIPGIITGHLALSKGRRTPVTTAGGNIAWIGLTLSYVNLVLVVFLLPVFAAILLPALGRARESTRRFSCQNNMKQVSIFLMIFEAESPDGRYPSLSPEAGRLMMTNVQEGSQSSIYPTYLDDLMDDLTILICPSDSDAALLDDSSSSADPSIFLDDHSYFYLGYVVTNDADVERFAKAYRAHISKGLPFVGDLDVPAAASTGENGKIVQLHKDIDATLQSRIPVLIERPDNHIPLGGNVLYMDGDVEFLRYPGEWPMTEKTIRTLEALDQL